MDKDNNTTPLIPVAESRTTSYDVYYYEQVRPHKKKICSACCCFTMLSTFLLLFFLLPRAPSMWIKVRHFPGWVCPISVHINS